MNRQITTASAPRPLSNYAQGIGVAAGSRLVFVSGQVGLSTEGEIPSDPARQHEFAWQNVLAVLAADGMTAADIAEAHIYITDRGHVGLFREVRDRMLRGATVANTLLVVAGLADPRFVVEIAVVAAAPAT